MSKISLLQTIINYLNENNRNYTINNNNNFDKYPINNKNLNIIKIMHDENYLTNIIIKPITQVVDFHLINIKSLNIDYQISLFYDENNDEQIRNTIIEQIKTIDRICEIINNIESNNNNNNSNNNTIKLELTINLAPEETNFENIFYNPNDLTDDDSKSSFFNNTLNIDNLKLYSSDIGDYVGKITEVKII